MSNFRNRSRRIARELYWEKNDRDTYRCPDCGRRESNIVGSFEVHHKNGEPMDNRPENHVALCQLCHNLRENKKPSRKSIRRLRDVASPSVTDSRDSDTSSPPTLYLAGSMDHENAEHQSWRSSVAERGDNGTYRYTGPTEIEINSPTEHSFSHGAGPVAGIAADDMRFIDKSDAILAYFEKKEQVGTLTEVVYAVTEGKPALVIFDESLVPVMNQAPLPEISNGISHEHLAPTYWFLINFLSGDGWDGLEADIKLEVVSNRDEIKKKFRDWDWQRAHTHNQVSVTELMDGKGESDV